MILFLSFVQLQFNYSTPTFNQKPIIVTQFDNLLKIINKNKVFQNNPIPSHTTLELSAAARTPHSEREREYFVDFLAHILPSTLAPTLTEDQTPAASKPFKTSRSTRISSPVSKLAPVVNAQVNGH
jgi:hypothetical protein